MSLERRLAELVADGVDFTADDVTANGTVTLDGDHSANGEQNGIGGLFNRASRRGLIEFTGAIARSKAPHRKGGTIRVWRGTSAGRLWAIDALNKQSA
jgi:hypothetical protein